MKKFWVVGIEYDTDGEIVGLPERMDAEYLPETMDVECDDINDAIDKVQDEIGWRVKSVKNIIEL
jgi:hypothetical protein